MTGTVKIQDMEIALHDIQIKNIYFPAVSSHVYFQRQKKATKSIGKTIFAQYAFAS